MMTAVFSSPSLVKTEKRRPERRRKLRLLVSDKEKNFEKTDGSTQKTVASEHRQIAWVCTQRDLEGRAVVFKGRGLWPGARLGRASRRGI